MTTKQEREATQNSPLNLAPPSASGYQVHGTGPGSEKIEQHAVHDAGHPALSKPKCAVFFSTFMKAEWSSFGCPLSDPTLDSPEDQILDIYDELATPQALYLDRNLTSRVRLAKLAQEHTEIVQEGMSMGMTVEYARLFASKK